MHFPKIAWHKSWQKKSNMLMKIPKIKQVLACIPSSIATNILQKKEEKKKNRH